MFLQKVKVLAAPYVLACDERFSVYKEYAVVFDTRIIELLPLESAKEKYGEVEYLSDTILMPGLINLHTHLEYGANKATLRYGSFGKWLDSVIESRDALQKSCTESVMQEQIDALIKSGTTTIGEVSSFGEDLESLAKSALRVIYFNEAIGSNPSAIDFLYSNFLARYEASLRYKSGRFYPAIAIHSPYSTHPILVKKVLEHASEETLLSAHFLESESEKEWLDAHTGYFKEFFERFFGISTQANFSAESFMDIFKNKKVLFTHMLEADDELLRRVAKEGHSIVSCPRSNRLLNNKILDLKKLQNLGISTALATDGLSSNASLSMFDELRCALFAYPLEECEEFCRELLLLATSKAGNCAKLGIGELATGKCADMIRITLPSGADETNIASAVVLHTQEALESYVEGGRIL